MNRSSVWQLHRLLDKLMSCLALTLTQQNTAIGFGAVGWTGRFRQSRLCNLQLPQLTIIKSLHEAQLLLWRYMSVELDKSMCVHSGVGQV